MKQLLIDLFTMIFLLSLMIFFALVFVGFDT